jgi:hypothetical protein
MKNRLLMAAAIGAILVATGAARAENADVTALKEQAAALKKQNEALGQVCLLDLGTGSVRVDPNVDADHHHLVCSSCGLVRDVPVIDVPALPARYRREFRTDAVEVIFRGVCEQCASLPSNS